MSIAAPESGTSFVLYDIPWETYEGILEALGDRRLRHTYVNGTLEMMSPSDEHESMTGVIGWMIETAAINLKRPFRIVRSKTQRHPDLSGGLEPDESYYVGRSRDELESYRDRPPDLVVEVEITHPLLERLDSYAILGVPEVWHYVDGRIDIHRRIEPPAYELVDRSIAFPELSAEDLTRFVARFANEEQWDVFEAFIAWVRERQPE